MPAIVFAILSALAQLFTTWMGWRVTIRPPEERNKHKLEAIFVLVGLLGVCFLSLGAYIAAKDQTKLQNDISDLKKGQQSVNSGITQANADIGIIKQKVDTPAVRVAPGASFPRRSRLHITKFELVPLSPGKPLYLNVNFQNNGRIDAEMQAYSLVTLVETSGDVSQQLKIEDSLFGGLAEVVQKGGSVPHTISAGGSELYFTDAGPVISKEDVERFLAGRYTGYFVGKIIYKDSAGSHETTYCVYTSGAYPNAIHLCRKHNQEQ